VRAGRLPSHRWPHDDITALRATLAVVLGAAAELAGIGLLATGTWLLLDASTRPPILLLSTAVALVRFFALLRGGAHWCQRLASHDLGLRVQARLQLWIFRQLERAWPTQASTGSLLAGLVSDTEAVQNLIVRTAVPLAATLSALLAAAGTAAFLLPKAGLVVLVVGLLGLLTTALASVVAAARRLRAQQARAAVSATIVDTLQAAEELAVLGCLPWALQLLDEAEVTLAQATGGVAWATSAGRFAAGALGVLGVLGTTVVAAKAELVGHLAPIGLGVVALVALGVAGLIATLPDTLSKAALGREAVTRLKAVGVDGAGSSGLTSPSGTRPHGARRPAELGAATLTLCHASIARPGPDHGNGCLLVSDLSLHLEPARPVALVGPSGSGKTSVLLTLLGFRPLVRGRLLINGTDASALSLEERRSRIAWAEEEPALFASTLRANLKVAAPTVSDDELLDVLEALGLGDWLRSLGRGLDSELGPWGTPVSGGERQRLGVARALLSGRGILLLDEPTAHLGPEDAAMVRKAILAASLTKGVLFVTQRVDDAACAAEVVTLRPVDEPAPCDRCASDHRRP
jgi:thiol reductant ABC exporter CydC subunit